LAGAVCLALLAGCASPIADPSPLMLKTSAPGTPVAGKSLVRVHRPRDRQGYGLYTGVWDRTNFVADMGNGHSTGYECEPGQHYFINRSVERVGVVETQLLPEKTYDLWIDTAGAFIASFQLEPVKPGDKASKLVPLWIKENMWVTRGPAAATHEQQRQKDIAIIIHDFVDGTKKDRVRHLGPDDYSR